MKEEENLFKYMNKLQYNFVQSLNEFSPVIVFIISVNERIIQFIDNRKVNAYGIQDNAFAFSDFLKTYLHPTETERFRIAFSKLNNNSISYYCGIFRILNTKTKKWNVFNIAIKEMDMLKIKHDDIFLGMAIDMKKLDITNVYFNNIVGELDFFNENKEKFKLLTKREREILLCICKCKTNFEIGQELFISQSTVETHRKRIIKKLSARNSLDLIHYARIFDTQKS